MPVKSSTSPVPDQTPPVRPLPQPSLASAEFWRAGGDGVLRVLRCADCGAYTHPPLPRCRSCRGDRVTMSPVSGRGVVAGFTVNHQQWLADFPPPYVIAVVALEEDDGVRLTSNIVGCRAEDVRIGMAVRVLFEKAGDVYVPLFEPDPEKTGQTLAIPADPACSSPSATWSRTLSSGRTRRPGTRPTIRRSSTAHAGAARRTSRCSRAPRCPRPDGDGRSWGRSR